MPDSSTLVMRVAGLGILLIALVVVGFVVVRIVRSRIRRDSPIETFTLQDLRNLRADGQLTEAEYERMRAMLIGHATHRAPNEKSRKPVRDADENSPT